ncbi:acyl carrier protein [Streptomyces graminifolii]|uniref:Acyl carrier protein n=2 Tax=unclassified Streptomyces TaxID=2593676 RepID=A0A3B8GHJ7_9ACTN|nr:MULTISPECIES: acyl carrier protein [unclassified Streptomyces]MCX4816355.1 acyl carrier protein [Streptomyces sp. NBC_01239]BBE36473.1 acyl carrier protein [Streptomyces sp. SoC090715LN-16]
MREITVEELFELTRERAGEPEERELNADVLDVVFEHLGYDSVALLEVLSEIRHRYGIELADEAMSRGRTPREVLEAVNGVIRDR